MDKNRRLQVLILLSLGYLVDFFDLTLFAAARAQILQSFHIDTTQALHVSRLMFNAQAIGIVLGGLIAGMWGDKIGRMSSVRMGIFLYSTAILCSIFTTSIDFFIFLRFLAGLGLAGELAASVTFVTEVSEGKTRDIGTSVIYFAGVFGGILATVLSAFVGWKTLFFMGAMAGFALLIFRMNIKDPMIFHAIKSEKNIAKGSLKLLFFNKQSLMRVIALTTLLVPFWFMVYFINFGPEIAKQIGLDSAPKQSTILTCFFIGSVFGTYLFGYFAGQFKSRKKTLLSAFAIMLVIISLFSFGPYLQLWHFYALMSALGVACGYPGIFTVLASESFGTNQRATGTCFVSCMGRGSIILINSFVPWTMGLFAASWTGIIVSNMIIFIISLLALSILKETHNRAINFTE